MGSSLFDMQDGGPITTQDCVVSTLFEVTNVFC